MFDSHCHLDAEEYDLDREAVLARAKQSGVRGIMVPGYEPREWSRLSALRDPIVCCGVGLHPWYVHEIGEAEREAALSDLPRLVRELGARAIGECGLDAPKAKRGGADLATQRRVLEVHLEVARQLKLPVILHCVGAHALLLEVLRCQGSLPAGGVLHSFSGSRELIRDYAPFGLYFSFAGIVTRENARRPREALAAVALERLLVESDGPDQAARDVAPGRSEPAHVALVLAAAAEIRGEDRALLAETTERNARRLFGLSG
jgi:TatD DNase family protein